MKYISLLIVLFLSSCSLLLEVNIYNDSGKTITIETGQSNITVNDKEIGKFHFGSDIVLIVDDKQFKYESGWDDLSEFFYGAISKNKVKAQIDKNLIIYLVKPKHTLPVSIFTEQPDGFPKQPSAI